MILSGRIFAEYLRPIFTGISVPHISPEQIRSFPVALPPLDEQQRIVEHLRHAVQTLEKTIQRTRHEIALIIEYRTRLIADVVTGKIDVRGFVPVLEAATEWQSIGPETDANNAEEIVGVGPRAYLTYSDDEADVDDVNEDTGAEQLAED